MCKAKREGEERGGVERGEGGERREERGDGREERRGEEEEEERVLMWTHKTTGCRAEGGEGIEVEKGRSSRGVRGERHVSVSTRLTSFHSPLPLRLLLFPLHFPPLPPDDICSPTLNVHIALITLCPWPLRWTTGSVESSRRRGRAPVSRVPQRILGTVAEDRHLFDRPSVISGPAQSVCQRTGGGTDTSFIPRANRDSQPHEDRTSYTPQLPPATPPTSPPLPSSIFNNSPFHKTHFLIMGNKRKNNECDFDHQSTPGFTRPCVGGGGGEQQRRCHSWGSNVRRFIPCSFQPE
ncbi:unnamed protein product [Pleuronectes platessa]|uniref:Uncharacterized protein n=1 Tax=Pleuronectes platessa TaxID=8262 RepID=A0A9N7YHM2_PLEPL|nr:unnamed protein product [Pleuronectes platessa]